MKKKILISLSLLTISFVHAQEFSSKIEEIDRQSQAVEQSKQIAQAYNQVNAFCSGQSYPAALATLCATELKAKLENEFKERLNLLVVHRLEIANKKLVDDLSEQKCLSAYRKKLEDLNIAYLPEQKCSDLIKLIP